MKTFIAIVLVFSLFGANSVFAQNIYFNILENAKSDIQEAEQAQQGRVILDSDANETSGTEPGIEHEDIGIQSTGAEGKESGEKGGTEDINIGVGELQEGDPDRPLIQGNVPNTTATGTSPGERVLQPEFGADAESESVQYNESDLEFLRERASDVSVSAIEVRGWDPEKKEALLSTVKDHAKVQSQQDLEHFAQGVLLEHEQVQSINANTSSVSIKQRVPARLFGLFNMRIEQETTITFGDGEHGRVKVKFPWTRFLYSIDSRYQQDSAEQALLPEVDDEVLVAFENGEATPSDQANVLEKLLSFFSE